MGRVVWCIQSEFCVKKRLLGLGLLLTSSAFAGIWFGGMMGADGTFLDDDSLARNHESVWIEGVSRRVFIGYMFSGLGLFRCPVSLEWSWDYFSKSIGSVKTMREASYELNRQWTAIARPGIRLGDGFVYGLASVDNTEISDTLTEHSLEKSQAVPLFPYSHLGVGLSFLVAPQTELMAEVRFSQKISKRLYSYLRGEDVALPTTSTEVSIYNTQLMVGLSYEF